MRDIREKSRGLRHNEFNYKGYLPYITDIHHISILYKDFNIYSSKIKSLLEKKIEDGNELTDKNKSEYISNSTILLRVTKNKDVLPKKQKHNHSNILKKFYSTITKAKASKI